MNSFITFKYKNLFFVPILILLSLLLLSGQNTVVQADEALDKQNAINYKRATPHPTKEYLLWKDNGFNENPISDYGMTTDGNTYIHTNFVHTIKLADLWGKSPQYIWHMKVDNEDWKTDYSSTGPNISVQSSKPGIIRYQLEVVFRNISYYSDVATVHIQSKPVNAKKLDIEVTSKYLYNLPNNSLTNNTAHAIAKPDPSTATEPVIWTTSDPSKATIDKNGLITAVPDNGKNDIPNQYNIFYIIGTIINKDGSIAVGQKLMSIGGGIYDQTARAGERATFTIQGFEVQSRDNNEPKLTVNWYKKGVKNPLTNSNEDPFSFTTDPLTSKNDGENYYAVISLSNNPKSSLTTGFGALTVLPAIDSQVQLTDEIHGSFNDPANNNSEIHSVVNGDTVTYKYHLNNSSKRDLHNTVLSTHLRLGTEITGITVDDIPITEGKDYTVSDHLENRNRLLEINIGRLNIDEGGDVVVTTKVQGVTDKTFFESKPSFIGLDSNNNPVQSIGSILTVDYISNQFIPKFKDIQFDSIYPFEEDVLKHRSLQTNAPNDIITIDDQRRNKSPVCIFLKQPVILNDEKNNHLAATLQFIGDQTDIPQPIQNKFPIAHSTINQPMKSISWKRDKGLLLHIDKKNPVPGIYSAKLTWIIQDSC